MKTIALLSLACFLSACSLSGITGTSSIALVCGTTTVNYSAGLIPQMQPVTATCTDPTTGKVDTASITPGMDIATLAALVKQNMAMHGEIVKVGQ